MTTPATALKSVIITVAVFIANNALSQLKTDTTFLLRRNDSIGYQAVFIDKANSIYHEKTFQLLDADSNSYREKLRHIFSIDSSKRQKSDFPNLFDWISIHTYDGKKYGYFPSEPYFNLLLRITDSAILINDFNDGFIPLIIKEFSIKKNKIFYKLSDAEKNISYLEFRLRKDGIAEIKGSTITKKKVLLVKREQFFDLPIIVNYCPNFRCQEFDFRGPSKRNAASSL